MSKVNVNLNAAVQPDGSVACQLECDGQQAKVTFTGTDVLFDVPEPAQPASAMRGGIEVEPDPLTVPALERTDDGGFTGNVVQEHYR